LRRATSDIGGLKVPRLARTVLANIPHHITQRGNRRERVFFDDVDRLGYLSLLREYADKHGVQILAYCLMDNHVHLVAVPADEEGLQRALKPVHMRYSQRINRAKSWTGHLWQGRFFSSPLGEDYLWAAIRYVERNPVRAQMVMAAQEYRWSSARAHCGMGCDPVLTQVPRWQELLTGVRDWKAWLAVEDEPEHLDALRKNVDRGIACGDVREGRGEAGGRYPIAIG
jgi:putative transposase